MEETILATWKYFTIARFLNYHKNICYVELKEIQHDNE